MLKKVAVSLRQKSYPIYIGAESYRRLPRLLSQHRLSGSALIVTQREIWKKWGKPIQSVLNQAELPTKLFIPSSRLKSEQMKSIDVFRDLLKALTLLDKKSKGVFVIALGGGVIGDLAGFAASVYKRGVPVVQIPTTLTAQVDSAIGGKTALDLPQGKNLLGSFHQPVFVLSDPMFLKTLPMDAYRDGMAEVIKYAAIKDKRLFRYLETHADDILKRQEDVCVRMITTCSQIKAQVVSRDEFDNKGIRAILNFGHTIGHAIEAASNYQGYSHGKAISIGMVAAADLSTSLSVLKAKGVTGRLRKSLGVYGLPTSLSSKVKCQKILNALLLDKKRIKGVNRFVLLKDIGRTHVYTNVPEKLIEQRVRKIYEHPKKDRESSGLLGLIFGKRRDSATTLTPVSAATETVGEVESFLSKISVAIVRLSHGAVQEGDRIGFEGRKTKFTMTIQSMQIHHKAVLSAKRGDTIGLRVPKKVRASSIFFAIRPFWPALFIIKSVSPRRLWKYRFRIWKACWREPDFSSP